MEAMISVGVMGYWLEDDCHYDYNFYRFLLLISATPAIVFLHDSIVTIIVCLRIL